MTGRVIQISTSRGGLPKYPVSSGTVNRLGIDGDAVAHPRIHGGPLQALLIITEEGIEELKALGYPVYPGAMGENITTRGLDCRQMRIGQRYRLGTAIVELTELRMPCNALDVYGASIKGAVYDSRVKAGNPDSPVWGLGGFYASVNEGGLIREQDTIELLDHAV